MILIGLGDIQAGTGAEGRDVMRSRYAGLFALSAAALMYELALTRIFAVAQGYHFAFLALSLALLGFGASGVWLAAWPRREQPERALAPLSAAMGLAIVASYLMVNRLPFDAYTMAWDPRQFLLLTLNAFSLVVPFLLAGLATGLALSAWPWSTPELYAANLAGSALGSLATLGALVTLEGAGTVLAAAAVACLAAGIFELGAGRQALWRWRLWAVLLAGLAALAWRPPAFLEVRLSPYRPLSYALRYPGARISYQRWNAYSRLDVIESRGIRSAPGLSLRYRGTLPEQCALAIDASDLSPITRSPSPDETAFLSALQGALPYRLRPLAHVLVLAPRGGLDVLQALCLGARRVEAVVSNPLLVHVVRDLYGSYAGSIYSDPRVQVHLAGVRSFLAHAPGPYDLAIFSLPQAYRPITAGSYALGEDYTYTVEAFQAALATLSPEGLLVAQGWLQFPPSETLRLAALASAALERLGIKDPRPQVVIYRDWALATLLVKRTPFSNRELAELRQFCEVNGFDLDAAPGLRPEETNRHHILPTTFAYEAYQRLLNPEERSAFIAGYPYDVSPTTDERPFFAHTFRWQQLPAAWQNLGRTAEPFGGGGYLVLLALLGLAVLISVALVGYTVARAGRERPPAAVLAYFFLLGAGYITVELVLMQRSILLLDQPTYAFATVLATLLLASGLGSKLSSRLSLGTVAFLLPLALGLEAWTWPLIAQPLLGAPLALRFLAVLGLVAPLGTLMGVPFPAGMACLVGGQPPAIAAIWAINGCASVLGSILATLAILGQGFAPVLSAGAICYLLAGLLLLARNWWIAVAGV